MKLLKEIYNLVENKRMIKAVQEASLDKKSQFGFQIENELLFGSSDWFKAINNGIIKKHIVTGTISKVFISGHNDYPEFEILNDDGKASVWTREGKDSAYQVGKRIELTFIEQKYKRPSDITGAVAKCILKIKVE